MKSFSFLKVLLDTVKLKRLEDGVISLGTGLWKVMDCANNKLIITTNEISHSFAYDEAGHIITYLIRLTLTLRRSIDGIG